MDGNKKHLMSTEDVVKDFGGLRAVNHVSLDIEEGEIRGLIGPNSSGKTTLINLITGIYKVNSGAIYFDGNRIDTLQSHIIAFMGVMRAFQISRVFNDMTLLENMILPALCQGQNETEAKISAEELLEFVLLSHLKDKPAKSLSGGQKMLLQIACGFMNKKLRLFAMDEPFAGVHQSIKGVILKAIKRMNQERGVSFLIVSHEMTTISNLCERISVLHKGEIISEGTMEEIANDSSVIDAYLGG